MTDGTGGQTYAYDDDDDLTQKNVTWTGFAAKTITYGFNPGGSRSSMNADNRAFTYSYDGVGRLSRVTNSNNEANRLRLPGKRLAANQKPGKLPHRHAHL